jgi:hypothetical protein
MRENLIFFFFSVLYEFLRTPALSNAPVLSGIIFQGAAWVYLLNPDDFLSTPRQEPDRPDSDYEHSDPNTSGSSGIGSLHSEQNAVVSLPRDGPDGEEDGDDADFYHEVRQHVTAAAVAPLPAVYRNGGGVGVDPFLHRRQITVKSDFYGGDGDSVSGRRPPRLKTGAEGTAAAARGRYDEHVNPSARYEVAAGQFLRSTGELLYCKTYYLVFLRFFMVQ